MIGLEMQEFLMWEAASRDTIDFKKAYVDMTGDLIAGLVLSELVYWFLPSKSGGTKLRVQHDEELWVAARLEDWWERARVKPKQARRALDILVSQGIVIRKVWKFNGDPTTHLRINEEAFLGAWKAALFSSYSGQGEAPPAPAESEEDESEVNEGKSLCPTGQNQMPYRAVPLTETTTETQTSVQGTRESEGDNSEEPATEEDESEAISIDGDSPGESLPLPPMGAAPVLQDVWRGGIGGEVKNPRAAAALARHYQRVGGGEVDVSNFPEDVRPWAAAFIKHSGQESPSSASGVAFWVKTFRGMQERNIDLETLKAAISKMRTESLTIKSPASVEAVAADILAVKRSANQNKNRLLRW